MRKMSMPCLRGFLDEILDHVVGISRVADGVGRRAGASGKDVGHFFAQSREAVPGVFLQEAHGGVEGRAAPHFHAEEIAAVARDVVGDGEHVVAAHARGEQRLVRVAESRVGDEQTFLLRGPLGKAFGALFSRICFVPGGCRARSVLWSSDGATVAEARRLGVAGVAFAVSGCR